MRPPAFACPLLCSSRPALCQTRRARASLCASRTKRRRIAHNARGSGRITPCHATKSTAGPTWPAPIPSPLSAPRPTASSAAPRHTPQLAARRLGWSGLYPRRGVASQRSPALSSSLDSRPLRRLRRPLATAAQFPPRAARLNPWPCSPQALPTRALRPSSA